MLRRRPGHQTLCIPGGGRVSTSVATGVPFLAMGELAVGVGERFAIGALGGATPNVPGFGVRPRAALIDTGALRLVISVPSLYYPFTNDASGSPWVLTRPSAVLEGRFASGLRIGGGLGVVAAASTDRLRGVRRGGYGGAFDAGVWNTVHLTVSGPVSSRAALFAEGALVLSGLRLAGDDWVGGPPVIASVGVTTDLF